MLGGFDDAPLAGFESAPNSPTKAADNFGGFDNLPPSPADFSNVDAGPDDSDNDGSDSGDSDVSDL